MNVQEIIEDIDLLAPNAFSVSRKIGWINQTQKQLHKEISTPYSSAPQDIREDQLTFVPRFPSEYHELLGLGAAKRIAERLQDFKTAGELEARFQNLLQEARENLGPRLKKVQVLRRWM